MFARGAHCANAFVVSLLGLRSMYPAINMRSQFIVRVSLCIDSDVVPERIKHKRRYRRLVSAGAKNTNAVMCTNELLWYNTYFCSFPDISLWDCCYTNLIVVLFRDKNLGVCGCGCGVIVRW